MVDIAVKHIVKCLYCGEAFDANTEEWVKPRSNRYAHKTCSEEAEASAAAEKDDFGILLDYIKELFDYEDIPAIIFKQIKKFIDEYGYTHSGICKSLKYFYEIKRGDKTKANGQLGIVPYIYEDAKKYYYSIWLAQQQNEEKNIDEYVRPAREIRISPPKRETMGRRRKLFSFLDEGDEE